MTITRDEVNFALEQYPNVRQPFYDAVNAYKDARAAKGRYDATLAFLLSYATIDFLSPQIVPLGSSKPTAHGQGRSLMLLRLLPTWHSSSK